MTYVIDRRLNGKNKSAVNRQRFLERYRKHIKGAVSDAIRNRSITDMDSGEEISIPRKDVSEPRFHHGPGGRQTVVHPGNKEFVAGDKIKRQAGSSGSGTGEGKASNTGEGDDDFVFQISQEEFLNYLFEDLELPNMLKKKLLGTESFEYKHAGIVSDGTPSKLHIVRSMRTSLSRRIALGGSARRRLKEAKAELQSLLEQSYPHDQKQIHDLEEEINHLEARIRKIPFLDPYDLRYNLHVKQPAPSSQAVMFCLMDVSGSMNQIMKDMAKRFFVLLYLFLQRNYKKIDVVFIRHHTSAKEVDEEEFFYSRETGGTIVSSALKLMSQIIEDRYPVTDWNIYAAQASDGDNWDDDSPLCADLLKSKILPYTQYYAYVEITPRMEQALWKQFEQVQEECSDHFAMQKIMSVDQIYHVFRDLFQRRAA
ncbi:MAG: YeaH/YhbH family protein [Gammaproteobacteria bacterium]|nr:YeaH/YhbH family protein [Gammaproteobacteria bacterium]